MARDSGRTGRRKIGYAVVGLGDIAQSAVLPAFQNARSNSRLVALVSGDPEKRRVLGRRYNVPAFASEDFDEVLTDENVDAVYLCSPNAGHAEQCIQAARAGVHVLCEKPMATTEADCRRMIRACADAGVKLMVAYRLHFERVNLRAIEWVQQGRIGEPRFLTSSFSYPLTASNIRADKALGGGALYDLGVYCINASRYLFRAEPEEVFAFATGEGHDRRFQGFPATFSVQLRFPGDRLASFMCSFDAADTDTFRLVGTRGTLDIEKPYSMLGTRSVTLERDGKRQHRTYPGTDQFGPELVTFSRCVLRDLEPEPSGHEGLADARVVDAIHKSLATHRPVRLPAIAHGRRPTRRQELVLPRVKAPPDIHAAPPH